MKGVILMISQMEMSNMLLETGGKVMLVIKWQRACLNCVCILWKVELVSDEITYLAEAISNESVKKVTSFLLTACSKM